MKKRALHLGIDIGTQSLKAVAVDGDLKVVGQGSVAYSADHPRPGWAQQDPGLWERALAPSIADALAQAGGEPGDAVSLGVAGQLDGCIAVDPATIEPFGPCLIWMDRRAHDCLPEGLDADDLRRRTGLVADATHMAAKIRWLKANAMGIDGAVFHQPVSYLVGRLTGSRVMDHALASTTMVYDLATSHWDDELCRVFAIDAAELPRLALAESTAGVLSSNGSAMTGLPAGLPVAVGTGDDFATPLGAGVIEPGTAISVVGTAEVVGALSSSLVLDDRGLVETHGYPGKQFFIENPGWLSGGAVSWVRQLLSFASDRDIDAEAAEVAPCSEGLLFLPALSGAMAPEWNPHMRGTFYGLTPGHSRGHLARAVLEGCAFAMADVLSRIRDLGIPLHRLAVLGGGASSDLWCQIRAQVADLETVAVTGEACARGAAVLGAVAVGRYPSLVEACRCIKMEGATFAPSREGVSAYRAAHARYRELFAALAPSASSLLP